jgi:hypothetical protein
MQAKIIDSRRLVNSITRLYQLPQNVLANVESGRGASPDLQ